MLEPDGPVSAKYRLLHVVMRYGKVDFPHQISPPSPGTFENYRNESQPSLFCCRFPKSKLNKKTVEGGRIPKSRSFSGNRAFPPQTERR